MRIPLTAVRIVFLLLCLLFLYSLPGRRLSVDDAWLGEHAWYQAHEGHVRSELMHGITRQDERVLVHHKLLTLHGSAVISLFGFTLPALKSISLAYFLLFVALAGWYLVRRRSLLTPDEFLLFLLLLFAHPLLFDLAFVFRPEVPMMFYGFLSYLLLAESLETGKGRAWLVLASGAAAGLCTGLHLNGVIFLLAGFVLLLVRRRYLFTLFLSAGFIVTAALYFYDFTGEYGFSFWFAQITGSPFHERTADYFGWKTILLSVFGEHLRWFHSPVESSLSLLLIVALLTGWKRLKGMRNLAVYTLVLVVGMGLVAIYKTSKYMVVYLPFVVWMILVVLKEASSESEQRGSRHIRIGWLLLIVLLIYLGIAAWFDVSLVRQKFSAAPHRAVTERYFRGRSERMTIVAPMGFVFNEIGRYKAIRSTLLYEEWLKVDPAWYGTGLLSRLNDDGVEALVLDGEAQKAFGLGGLTPDSITSGYRVTGREPGWLILERVTP